MTSRAGPQSPMHETAPVPVEPPPELPTVPPLPSVAPATPPVAPPRPAAVPPAFVPAAASALVPPEAALPWTPSPSLPQPSGAPKQATVAPKATVRMPIPRSTTSLLSSNDHSILETERVGSLACTLVPFCASTLADGSRPCSYLWLNAPLMVVSWRVRQSLAASARKRPLVIA